MPAKMTNPYLRWFDGEFLRETSMWTALERYAYFRLLCTEWEVGPLPLDLIRLSTAVIGVESEEFMVLWKTVSARFKKTKTGYVNERIEAERATRAAYVAKQSANGKRRWKNSATVIRFPKDA